MTALHPDFLKLPLTHRGYHDVNDGRPENSRAAIHAAVNAGYGIEIDVQLTSDAQAVVFHDYELPRLTGMTGLVRAHALTELDDVTLTGGDEGIPTLSEILKIIAGKVPLVIEIKDQAGNMGVDVGPLEEVTLAALQGYEGPLAVMSFNPNSVAAMAQMAPHIPRGIVTSDFDPAEWPELTPERCAQLRLIPDYERVGACFVSHQANQLNNPRIAEIKAQGGAVLCWTIKSLEQEQQARTIAQNITFEGYAAAFP